MSIEKQVYIPSKKISELDTGSASLDSVVPIVNGEFTKKIKLKNIVDLPHQHNAQDVNFAYGGYNTVQQALEHLLYKEPIVEIYNDVGTVQNGVSINTVTITWNLIQGQITAQNLTDAGNLPQFLRSYTFNNTSITSDRTYTLEYTDGSNMKNVSTYINFRNKRYWGVSALQTLEDYHIRYMNSEFAISKEQSRVFNPSNQFIYFAWPESFGAASFKFNGLPNSAWEMTTRNFINSSNYLERYILYKSTFLQSGLNINIEVF